MIGDKIAQRTAFGECLVKIADEFPQMVVLDPDVGPSTQASIFKDHYPARFYNTGIAEQNAVGIAAGMACEGLIPWVSAFAVFLAHRSGDQIRNSVAHTKANVKLNGSYAGLPTGRAGATHSAVEDLAIIRSLPNMIIIEPADAVETMYFTRMATGMDGPVYLRTVRCEVPTIFNDSHCPEFGKAVPLREGTDVSLISTGMMTARVLEAGEILHRQGVSAEILHVPVIKPIDQDAIVKTAKKTGLIVTVENHSVIGGLGSAMCETVTEKAPCRVHRLGYQDIFLESGDDEVLFDRYGLNALRISEFVLESLKNINGEKNENRSH
jgi:transketolase